MVEHAVVLGDGLLLELFEGRLLGGLQRLIHRAARDAVDQRVVILDELIEIHTAGPIRVCLGELGLDKLRHVLAVERDTLPLQQTHEQALQLRGIHLTRAISIGRCKCIFSRCLPLRQFGRRSRLGF